MEYLTAPGKVRLLVRRNGVLGPTQTYSTSELETALNVLQALPFFPISQKELIIPSIAELCDVVDNDTDTADKRVQPVDFAWIEVECDDDVAIDKVLNLFPIHSSTIEDVRNGTNDREGAEIFPSCGYASISAEARHDTKTSLGDEEYEPVKVCMIAFEQVLLTIFRRPLAWGDELRAQMELILSSSTSYAAPVSISVCSLVSAFVKDYQKETSSLLADVDSVNEIVLQIQPSRCDHLDFMQRIENLRHRLSRVQASFLTKERLIQQLMLPVMRHIFITADPSAASRYQRLLSGLLLSIERLRRGRDVLNLSSMSLVSGVSMRLFQHCYYMDFVTNVMTQMALVTMPIGVIPGVFTMNVQVPFQEAETLLPFFMITLVTVVAFVVGIINPVNTYFRFKPPGALVT
ncbi:putative zinc transporter [Trypanosoma rangeli]|uniref:Putative zinc transporter n=1 Tax=Trypanosoma rangeli TaxID=5698 RepID=A0A3S5IQJ8_TRYRA|nr:putative zinc transporter [Trypanosoma rangeli]RNF00672.1 putative zinc transporter [Trypanosoma rangeli]|eukprot:RNF00672.1 putative zinc transporter [Trypanosoma rangeli]